MERAGDREQLPAQAPQGDSIDFLRLLAEDVRQRIISVSLKNGGHLGASLGTVELAIALHSVFRSPEEPIVWDVGHQAYAHKLLTGRWEKFDTLRQEGGISGFLSREESPHDVFGAGHSSTSLSAALAMAWARGRAQDPATAPWTVAVIGDGGLTAGLAFEALNNVSSAGTLGPLLVVLNDNQMSISPNVGGVPSILSAERVGEFFRVFGFDYFGPINGHDIEGLVTALRAIKTNYSGRPILLHALTEKGRGYAPAEERPATYHGISPASTGVATTSWSQAFGQALCELADRDERVVAITAAMPEGTGLSEFARRFPTRFFDVGIAEAHAVTFAAGLATQGFKPVVAVYSTFLQRAFDSLIHDLALQKLGVVLAIDRAGMVGADGPTHHGAFDMSYLGLIPGMKILAPSALGELPGVLDAAIAAGGPVAIRYPRGGGPASLAGREENGVKWLREEDSPRLIALAVGASAARALEAASSLVGVSVLAVSQVKPIPECLLSVLSGNPGVAVLTVEDGAGRGGFGEALKSALPSRSGAFQSAAYADRFYEQGTPKNLEEKAGVSVTALRTKMAELLSK